MLILCKIWLGKLHLWPLEVSPIDHVMSTVRYSVYLSIEMTTLIGSFLYVLSNLGDIDEATEPGFVCFAFGTTVFIYVWLVSKKHLIESAIDKLELCVNASELNCSLCLSLFLNFYWHFVTRSEVIGFYNFVFEIKETQN